MAIGAGTVWRVGPGGNLANGTGYDATISGAGTDYTQQNAAQASGTAGTAAATTNFSDAAALFTSAMVGNAINIASGAGFTVGFYFIVAFVNSSNVTLDRSPGTGSAANWKVGGRGGNSTTAPWYLWDSSRATGNKAVAGNKILAFGNGGSWASPDYSFTGGLLNPPVNGDTTGGAVWIIGDPAGTKPFIKRTDAESIAVNGMTYARWFNLNIMLGAAAGGRTFDPGVACAFGDVSFNMNDLDFQIFNGGTLLFNVEVFSKTTGTPTSRTTAILGASGLTVPVIYKSYFHDTGGPVLSLGAGGVVIKSVFANGVKEYITNGTTDDRLPVVLVGNDFDKCAADAIKITQLAALATTVALDNIYSNNTGVGKYAINVSVGSLALNDRLKMFMDFCDYYNNTANVNGFTAGTNDLTLDPQYVTSPTNLTLNGTNLAGQAYPRTTMNGNTSQRDYSDIGALQRQATGGTVIVPNINRNIFMNEETADGS